MQQPLLKSIIFHLVVAILLVASSWSIFSRREKIPEIKPIVVQLAPMGEKTNLKPAPKQDITPPKPKKPEPKKPEPKKPEPKKPEPKKPEPKKPEPKPDPKKPEPKKSEKKKDDLDKMLETLDKPDKKKTEEKPKENNELNDLLKDLDKKPEATKSTDQTDTNPNSKSDLPFDPNSPESLAVIDYITKLLIDQIKPCWSPPAGSRDAQNMVVRLNIDITQDGTMKFVGFEGAASGPAADAARRAILDPACNPLKTLPPVDKYYIWKEMTLTFDPKEMVY